MRLLELLPCFIPWISLTSSSCTLRKVERIPFLSVAQEAPCLEAPWETGKTAIHLNTVRFWRPTQILKKRWKNTNLRTRSRIWFWPVHLEQPLKICQRITNSHLLFLLSIFAKICHLLYETSFVCVYVCVHRHALKRMDFAHIMSLEISFHHVYVLNNTLIAEIIAYD